MSARKVPKFGEVIFAPRQTVELFRYSPKWNELFEAGVRILPEESAVLTLGSSVPIQAAFEIWDYYLRDIEHVPEIEIVTLGGFIAGYGTRAAFREWSEPYVEGVSRLFEAYESGVPLDDLIVG